MILEQDLRGTTTDPTALPEPADVSAPFRATAKLGAQAEDIADRFYKAKQYSAIFAARRDAQTALSQARDDALANPDPDAGEKAYALASRQVQGQVTNMGIDDFTRERIGLNFAYTNQMMQSHVSHNALEKRISQGQADLEQSLDFNRKNAYVAGDTDLGSYKDKADQNIDDAIAGGFVAKAAGQKLKDREHFGLDHTSAYNMVTQGDPQQAIDALDARNQDNSLTNWPDLTGIPRDELRNSAVHKLGAGAEGVSALRAQVLKDALEGGIAPTAADQAKWIKQGVPQKYVKELSAEGQYTAQAHSVIRGASQVPDDQIEGLIEKSGLFPKSVAGKTDDDTLYRKYAEDATRNAINQMKSDRNKDIGQFVDDNMPLPQGASEADKIRNRMSWASKLGVNPQPYSQAKAQGLASAMTDVRLDDGQRVGLWNKMNSDLGDSDVAKQAFWDQMHNKMKVPQLAFDIDPSDPAKNAMIMRTLEAKQGGYLGKDIPPDQVKNIKNGAMTSLWSVAQNQHWDDQKRALWGEAVQDLAMTMKDGNKAWDTLYSSKYDDTGIPKSLPPQQRDSVGFARMGVMNALPDLPLVKAAGESTGPYRSIRSEGQWDLRGNDDLFQLKDGQGNPVMKENGAPLQFRTGDTQRFMKYNPDAAKANANASFFDRVSGLTPEWTFDKQAFDQYTDELWRSQQATQLPPTAATFKPQIAKPAIVGGETAARKRGR